MFHNFKQLNIEAASAHHPIIQQEVDELLAEGAIEPSSCGAGFHCNVLAVPKCTEDLWPILNFKQFNQYMHIPILRMPIIRHVWQIIQHGDYAFSIDLKDAYLLISIVKCHCHFYDLFGKICHINGKYYPLGWPQPLGLSLPSLHFSCSFVDTKVSVLLSI